MEALLWLGGNIKFVLYAGRVYLVLTKHKWMRNYFEQGILVII